MEFVAFVAPWMDLEGVMLSKISQTERNKYCTISLTCGIVKKQTELIEAENTHCLTNNYEVDDSTALNDCRRLLAEWRDCGLVVGAGQ